MASLGVLVSGVAHEINTPVRIGITAITHLDETTKNIQKSFKENKITEEELNNYLNTSSELIKTVQTNLYNASTTINSFKQIAIDKSAEIKRNFNVKEYTEAVITSLNSILKDTKHTVTINCKPDLVINSYPGAFAHILNNLILNSIRHAFNKEKKGQILIDIEKSNKHITLKYKDNGEGIKKEFIDKIFDPFFTTNRTEGGKGLGLSVIYNIVSNTFNGEITCNSIEKEGTEFIFVFNISNE